MHAPTSDRNEHHLVRAARNRGVTGYGLYVDLTERCPLSCAHCSTNSTLRSPGQIDGEALLRYLGTMHPDTAPALVLLTGGEPLLLPRLVERIHRSNRTHGIDTQILTGGFWIARRARRIRRLLREIGNVSFSHDSFHDEVDEAGLLDELAALSGDGVRCALQIVHDPRSPRYTRAFVDRVRQRFGHDVPVHVAKLGAVGRARDLAAVSRARSHDAPCIRACWPVITHRGDILACCSQEALSHGNPPAHLCLGHIGTQTHGDVARSLASRLALRAVRACGPAVFDETRVPRVGYCDACLGHEGHPSHEDQGLQARFDNQQGPLRERTLPLLPMTMLDRQVDNEEAFER